MYVDIAMVLTLLFENEDVVDVKLDLTLQTVENIDGKKNQISTFVWLSLTWVDTFLVWNRSEVTVSQN